MGKTESVAALIGRVYDAALDRSLWPEVLEQAARFVGGAAASIYSKDLVGGTANITYQHGLDAGYVNLYTQKFVRRVPASGYFEADVEKPLSSADIVGNKLIKTRFYKLWMRPQGLVDSLHVLLDKSRTDGTAFVVFRHERDGLVEAAPCMRMQLLAPHVRRAALIGKLIELKTAESAILADTLDTIGAGMFLVDARGIVVHANAAGQAMLAEGSVLRIVAGRLAAHDAREDHALHDSFLAAASGDSAIDLKGIAVPLAARGGGRFVAHVLPLTCGARGRAGKTYSAVAAVFAHKAAIDVPSAPEALAKTYRLTPAELRVLLAIVEVGGVPEIAEALGIAETTVKFHLRNLFAKTGAKRQAELVKLVAAFTNPLSH
jgi:DNA-binding CsgD family transcriptional regulator/PAS domain-containing protein